MLLLPFIGRDIVVAHTPGIRAAVISFDHWRQSRRDVVPFAEPVVERFGFGHIRVLATSNNWFQSDEAWAAMDAIRDAAASYPHRCAYGHSMGAYGALAFASGVGATSVLAVSPQSSIMPDQPPFERRWEEDAARITWALPPLSLMRVPSSTYVLYDPEYEADARHAPFMPKGVVELHAPGAGHWPLTQMVDNKSAQELLRRVTLGEPVPRLVSALVEIAA